MLLRLLLLAAALIAFDSGSPSVALAQDDSSFPPVYRPGLRIRTPEWGSEASRDQRGEAEKVMDWLSIRTGDRVAHIRAGRGYYTLRLARRLGQTGILYAEDENPGYLAELRGRLEREGFPFVLVVQGEGGDPRLPPGSVDIAILDHRYHEIENPYEFFYRLFPSLAPGARLGIIEEERPTDHEGTPAALLRCELGALGYRETQFTFLTPSTAYLAIFVAPEALPPVSQIRACGAE
ncbi:MAG: methyltransferase domain-containing protein [Gemmatimonadota bacterium]